MQRSSTRIVGINDTPLFFIATDELDKHDKYDTLLNHTKHSFTKKRV